MMEFGQDEKALLDVDIRKRLKGFELEIRFSSGNGCLGILGPSGCGKSMTLKSIAGIIKPDSGAIRLGQRLLYQSEQKINLSPQERRVGYLFQNYALFPNMTVEENIQAGLGKNRGRGRREFSGERRQQQERVGELIERFRLKGLEKRYPAQLSGGQQQRVALARILAYEPETLLLDEPFSAMDTYLKEGLRLELSGVLKDYRGVSVLVTHDRDEVYQLCENLLLMNQGKVLAAGKTRDIFQNPGTCQAARLTGCKNTSRIRKLGTHRVKALDWGGLELVTKEPVGDEITAVGIRAHELEPLSSGEAENWKLREGANLIPVENPRISELPFEWYITLENGLWWKTRKTIGAHDSAGIVPEWLRADPSAILLLRGEWKGRLKI
ncbi:MAG: ATP-binding cassette domain-containing protein [Lachnospiraceae bacterium]|nr:ATP-binding cassette domain-containing protein [Lachnospiraceae bacterium]